MTSGQEGREESSKGNRCEVRASPRVTRRVSLVAAVRTEDPHLYAWRLHLLAAGSRPI